MLGISSSFEPRMGLQSAFAIHSTQKGAATYSNRNKTRNPDFGPISDFGFYKISVRIGLMGWIRIGFALLNTFANCDFPRFVEIFTFLGNLY